MRYVLGINGGGSKIDALVVDETGHIVGHGRVHGPSNERLITLEGQRKLVVQAIDAALGGNDSPAIRFSAARISLLSSGPSIRRMLDAPGLRDRFESIDDCSGGEGSIAATGALGKSYDPYNVVVIVAGTGSCGWAHTRDGRERLVGGWGEWLGDEGSGYAIAMSGLRAAIHASEGVGETTTLRKRAIDFFGLRELRELAEQTYRDPGIPREKFASFCQEVFAAAREGDPAAIAALRQAADYLARLAGALIRKLEMHGSQIYVVPSGSVWKGGGELAKTFAATLTRLAPTASILKPHFDPVVGAALEGLYAAGIDVNDRLVARLRQSLPPELAP